MTSNDLVSKQQSICRLYGTDYVASPANHRLGLARDFDPSRLPIHGERGPVKGEWSAWMIWSGEELCSDDDHFLAFHIRHFYDANEDVSHYLGLSPGWRFVLAPGYADVWFDPDLLRDE